MASVKIILFKHKTLKDGSHPVILQVIHNKQRKIVSLGYSATEKQWNSKNNVPNSKHPHVDKLKALIRKKKNEAEKKIIELDTLGEPYLAEDILMPLKENKKTALFKSFTEKQVATMRKEGRHGNARAYEDAMKAFTTFLSKDDIDFKNINTGLIRQFESHLKSKGRKVNGIAMYLRTIRAIYNKAIKDGEVSEKFYPFKDFKIKHEKTIKRAIPKGKLTEIKNLDLSQRPAIELARDIFLFSFYMRGMNFIDIFHLKPKDIAHGRVDYRRKKTGQVFSIKVNEPALYLIHKYGKDKEPDQFIFPVLNPDDEYTSYRTSIRNLNKYLKDVGEEVELDIPLSSYVARHSWAQVAKLSGISTSVISEGLGHDSEKTTSIYLDSFSDEVLDDANEKIIDNI